MCRWRGRPEDTALIRAECLPYLEELSRLPALSGLRVETLVHTAEVGDVARSIAQHSAELAPDLIVMCTHSKGGARRLLFGMIAQKVISLGSTPVLMVRPSKETQAIGAVRCILVPITGDPGDEKGLPMATEIAQAFHLQAASSYGGAKTVQFERPKGRHPTYSAGCHTTQSGDGE